MRRDIFYAIADPTRRNILLSLLNESQNINTLAHTFEMTRQAVSLHIKYLQECGAITIKKEGRERHCTIELQKLTEVAYWLAPFRKMWTGKLNQLDQLLDELLDELQSKPEKGS